MAKQNLRKDIKTTKTGVVNTRHKALRSKLFIILIAFLLLGGGFASFTLFLNTSKPAVASQLDAPTSVKVNPTEISLGDPCNLTFNGVDYADGYAVYIINTEDFESEEQVVEELENNNAIQPIFSFSGTQRDISRYVTKTGQYYVAVRSLYFRVSSYNSQISKLATFTATTTLVAPTLLIDNDNYLCSWEDLSNMSGSRSMYDLGELFYDLEVYTKIDFEKYKSSETELENHILISKQVFGNTYTFNQEEKELLNSKPTAEFVIRVKANSLNPYIFESGWTQLKDGEKSNFHTYKTINSFSINQQKEVDETKPKENNTEFTLSWNQVELEKYYDITYQVFVNGVKIKTIDKNNKNYFLSGKVYSYSYDKKTLENDVGRRVGIFEVSVVAKSDFSYIRSSTSSSIEFSLYEETDEISTIRNDAQLKEDELIVERQNEKIYVSWKNFADKITYDAIYKVFLQDENDNYYSIPGQDAEYYIALRGTSFSFDIAQNETGYFKISVVVERQEEFYLPSPKATKIFKFKTSEESGDDDSVNLATPLNVSVPKDAHETSILGVLKWDYSLNPNALIDYQTSPVTIYNFPQSTDNNGFKILIYNAFNDIVYTKILERDLISSDGKIFSLEDFLNNTNPGLYSVSVTALGGFLMFDESQESEKVEFSVKATLSAPQNVHFVENSDITQTQLVFGTVQVAAADQDSIRYAIYVNDEYSCLYVDSSDARVYYEVEGKQPKRLDNYTATIDSDTVTLTGFDVFFNKNTIVNSKSFGGIGITGFNLNEGTFADRITENGIYSFEYDEEHGTWMLNSNAVNLNSYGITVAGVPANGDWIQIDFLKKLPQGSYQFSVKAFADPDNSYKYKDSDLSNKATIDFVRFVAAPVITTNQTENSNDIFAEWKRTDADSNPIYNESTQDFVLYVNKTQISINHIQLNGLISSNQRYYRYKINDYVFPNAKNELYIKALSTDDYVGTDSNVVQNFEYIYYIEESYNFDSVTVSGDVHKKDSILDEEEVVFTLSFVSDKYANCFEFVFDGDDSKTIRKNVYYDGKTDYRVFYTIPIEYLNESTETSFTLQISYDASLESKNTNIRSSCVKATQKIAYNFVDTVRMPRVEDFSYDKNTSLFSWKFPSSKINYITSFGYSYLMSGYSEMKYGSFDKNSGELVGNYVYFNTPFYFDVAGNVTFSIWVYSSSSSVQSGANKQTIQSEVYVKLKAPDEITISTSAQTQEVLVSWLPVEHTRQNTTGQVYLLSLYEYASEDALEGTLLGTTYVDFSSSAISVPATAAYSNLLSQRKIIKASVKTLGYLIDGGGAYLDSDVSESNLFKYFPTIKKPQTTLNQSNLIIEKVIVNGINFANKYTVCCYNTNGLEPEQDPEIITLASYEIGSVGSQDFEEDSVSLTFKLGNYLKPKTIVNGVFKVFVVAENTEWLLESGETVKSQRSDEKEFDVTQVLSSPQIFSSQALVGEPQGGMPTLSVEFLSSKVETMGQNGTLVNVSPGSYQFDVYKSDETLRIFGITVNFDEESGIPTTLSTNSLSLDGHEAEFVCVDGKYKAYYDDFCYGVFYKNETRSYFEYYAELSGTLNVFYNYQIKLTALKNEAYYVNTSITRSLTLSLKSNVIGTPTIGFYENLENTLKNYVLINSATNTDNVVISVSRAPYSLGSTIKVMVEGIYLTDYNTTLTKENVTILPDYYIYYFNVKEVIGNREGIFGITIQFEGTPTAIGSKPSNAIFVYNSSKINDIFDFQVERQEVNSTDPAVLKVTIFEELLNTGTTGFDLVVSTVDGTESGFESQVTELSLGFNHVYLEQTKTSTDSVSGKKLKTYVYEVPISVINGFLKPGRTNPIWDTFDYDFLFSIRLSNAMETTVESFKQQVESIIGVDYTSNYGPEDGFVFKTFSDYANKKINTSSRTSIPINLTLSDDGVVSWDEVENAYYGYVYYKWDLTQNTYTLYKNGGTEALTFDGRIYFDALKTKLFYDESNSSYDNYEETDFWTITNSNSFSLNSFQSEKNTTVYGVLVFAKSNDDSIGFSKVSYTTLFNGAREVELNNFKVIWNTVLERYQVVWDDPFESFSQDLLTNETKTGFYDIYLSSLNTVTENYKGPNINIDLSGNTILTLSDNITGEIRDYTLVVYVNDFAIRDELLKEFLIIDGIKSETDVLLPLTVSENVWLNVTEENDHNTYKLTWKAVYIKQNFTATKYYFIVTEAGDTTDQSFVNAKDWILVTVPLIENEEESFQILASNELGNFSEPITGSILTDGNDKVYYECDITSWFKKLPTLGLSEGDYKLWAVVASDESQNIVSDMLMNGNGTSGGYRETSCDFKLYKSLGKAKDITYIYTSEPTRSKSLEFTVTQDEYYNTAFRVEIESSNHEKQNLNTSANRETYPIYAIYFAKIGLHTSFIFNEINPSDVVTDNTLGTATITVDMFDYLELLDAGYYYAYVTIVPTQELDAQNYKSGERTCSNAFANNRKLVVDTSQELFVVVLDSFIERIENGEPVFAVSYEETKDAYLKDNLFNTKKILLEVEKPSNVDFYLIRFYKNSVCKASVDVRNLADLSMAGFTLEPGVYTLTIQAMNNTNQDLYANSDETDYTFGETAGVPNKSTITIYQRHMIKIDNDVDYFATQTREGVYRDLKDVTIKHGITEIGETYEIYCYEVTGYDLDAKGNQVPILAENPVWVESTETVAIEPGKVNPDVSLYNFIFDHISDMNYADYVFKTKWISSNADLSNYILNSDLNETKGSLYVHQIDWLQANFESASIILKHDSLDGYVCEIRTKTVGGKTYSWKDSSISGYVDESKLYIALIDPSLDTTLRYAVTVGGTNAIFTAYVKVSYQFNSVTQIYDIDYSFSDRPDYITSSYFSLALMNVYDEEIGDYVDRTYLIFDCLEYIYRTTYIVGKYEFNSHFENVYRGGEGLADPVDITPKAQEKANNVSLGMSSGEYEFIDVYATKNDLFDKVDAANDYFGNMEKQLVISDVSLVTDKSSSDYGRLSFNVRNLVRNISGNDIEVQIKVNISVNGALINLENPTINTGGTEQFFSYDLKNVLWADQKTDQNANSIQIFVSDSGEGLNYYKWLDSPAFVEIKVDSTENLVSDDDFMWQTELTRGMYVDPNTLNWTTGAGDKDPGEVFFSATFNPYYSEDSRLWNGDEPSAEFEVVVVRIDRSFESGHEYPSFEEVNGLTDQELADIYNGIKGVFSQADLEAWCESVSNEKGYNMTLDITKGKETDYSFNMKSFLDYIDAGELKWVDSAGLLPNGYYYLAVCVASDKLQTEYDNGILWEMDKTILSPWNVYDVSVVGIQDLPEAILTRDAEVLNLENAPKLVVEGETDPEINNDTNKLAWAKKVPQRYVYLKFKVDAIGGEYPLSYAIKRDGEQNFNGITTHADGLSFEEGSEIPYEGYIYLNISSFYQADGIFKNSYGKNYFKVYGLERTGIASKSIDESAGETDVAMLHYIQFNPVTNVSVNDINNQITIEYQWNCDTDLFDKIKVESESNPNASISVVITNKIDDSLEGASVSRDVLTDGNEEVTNPYHNYSYRFNIAIPGNSGNPNSNQLLMKISNQEVYTNNLSFVVARNNLFSEYIFDSEPEEKPYIDPKGLDAPKVAVSMAKSGNYYNIVSEGDSFNSSAVYYNLAFTIKSIAFEGDATSSQAVIKFTFDVGAEEQKIFYAFVTLNGDSYTSIRKINLSFWTSAKIENNKILPDGTKLDEKIYDNITTSTQTGKPKITLGYYKKIESTVSLEDVDTRYIEFKEIPLNLGWIFDSASTSSFYYLKMQTIKMSTQIYNKGNGKTIQDKDGNTYDVYNGTSEIKFNHFVRIHTPEVSSIVFENNDDIMKNNELKYVDKNNDGIPETDFNTVITITNVSKNADSIAVYIGTNSDQEAFKSLQLNDYLGFSVLNNSNNYYIGFKCYINNYWDSNLLNVEDEGETYTITITLNADSLSYYYDWRKPVYGFYVDHFIPGNIYVYARCFNSNLISTVYAHNNGQNAFTPIFMNSVYVNDALVTSGDLCAKLNTIVDNIGNFSTPIAQDFYASTDNNQPNEMFLSISCKNVTSYLSAYKQSAQVKKQLAPAKLDFSFKSFDEENGSRKQEGDGGIVTYYDNSKEETVNTNLYKRSINSDEVDVYNFFVEVDEGYKNYVHGQEVLSVQSKTQNLNVTFNIEVNYGTGKLTYSPTNSEIDSNSDYTLITRLYEDLIKKLSNLSEGKELTFSVSVSLGNGNGLWTTSDTTSRTFKFFYRPNTITNIKVDTSKIEFSNEEKTGGDVGLLIPSNIPFEFNYTASNNKSIYANNFVIRVYHVEDTELDGQAAQGTIVKTNGFEQNGRRTLNLANLDSHSEDYPNNNTTIYDALANFKFSDWTKGSKWCFSIQPKFTMNVGGSDLTVYGEEIKMLKTNEQGEKEPDPYTLMLKYTHLRNIETHYEFSGIMNQYIYDSEGNFKPIDAEDVDGTLLSLITAMPEVAMNEATQNNYAIYVEDIAGFHKEINWSHWSIFLYDKNGNFIQEFKNDGKDEDEENGTFIMSQFVQDLNFIMAQRPGGEYKISYKIRGSEDNSTITGEESDKYEFTYRKIFNIGLQNQERLNFAQTEEKITFTPGNTDPNNETGLEPSIIKGNNKYYFNEFGANYGLTVKLELLQSNVYTKFSENKDNPRAWIEEPTTDNFKNPYFGQSKTTNSIKIETTYLESLRYTSKDLEAILELYNTDIPANKKIDLSGLAGLMADGYVCDYPYSQNNSSYYSRHLQLGVNHFRVTVLPKNNYGYEIGYTYDTQIEIYLPENLRPKVGEIAAAEYVQQIAGGRIKYELSGDDNLSYCYTDDTYANLLNEKNKLDNAVHVTGNKQSYWTIEGETKGLSYEELQERKAKNNQDLNYHKALADKVQELNTKYLGYTNLSEAKLKETLNDEDKVSPNERKWLGIPTNIDSLNKEKLVNIILKRCISENNGNTKQYFNGSQTQYLLNAQGREFVVSQSGEVKLKDSGVYNNILKIKNYSTHPAINQEVIVYNGMQYTNENMSYDAPVQDGNQAYITKSLSIDAYYYYGVKNLLNYIAIEASDYYNFVLDLSGNGSYSYDVPYYTENLNDPEKYGSTGRITISKNSLNGNDLVLERVITGEQYSRSSLTCQYETQEEDEETGEIITKLESKAVTLDTSWSRWQTMGGILNKNKKYLYIKVLGNMDGTNAEFFDTLNNVKISLTSPFMGTGMAKYLNCDGNKANATVNDGKITKDYDPFSVKDEKDNYFVEQKANSTIFECSINCHTHGSLGGENITGTRHTGFDVTTKVNTFETTYLQKSSIYSEFEARWSWHLNVLGWEDIYNNRKFSFEFTGKGTQEKSTDETQEYARIPVMWANEQDGVPIKEGPKIQDFLTTIKFNNSNRISGFLLQSFNKLYG